MTFLDGYEATPRVIPQRHRERARYDRASVHSVLDEGLIAHIAFLTDDGAPGVLPTTYVRLGETIYLHGSTGGRFGGLDGAPLSVSVTLVDGLVFAPAWLNHSAAYRCVVAHGTARLVTDEDERMSALAALLEHIAAGRSRQARPPTRKEAAGTAVIALELREVSCKVRDDTVGAEPDELQGPHWAGVVPLRQTAGPARPAPGLAAGIPVPAALADYRGPAAPSPAGS